MPVLDKGLTRFHGAFWHLIADRNMNGIIPTSETVAYLDGIGVSGVAERSRWLRFIRAMDLEHRAAMEEYGDGEGANG